MTARKKKGGGSKRPNGSAGATGELTVRMYDVGFGDCFLVSIPDGSRTRRILVDCGSIKAGSSPMSDVVSALVADVTDADGVARIDVVVATHRHRDHVAGFADPAWDAVEVGEVWMPWTEDPRNPLAARVRNAQSRLALELETRLRIRLAAAKGAERDRLDQAHQLALNALSNERAMRTLHHGFRGSPKRRFLPQAKVGMRSFSVSALPSAAVYCLGPSRDLDVIREMDPPAGQGYLQLIDDTLQADETPSPFGAEWMLSPGDYGQSYRELAQSISPVDARDLREIGAGREGIVAAALDKAVNGTSLMLVIQIRDRTLFFPGDAQWGTWRKVLADPAARRLLEKTDLLKVGHHGSHNATPVEFVEQVAPEGLLAMVSTAKMSQWPRIPKAELLDALKKRKAKIARSDQPTRIPSGYRRHGTNAVDATLKV